MPVPSSFWLRVDVSALTAKIDAGKAPDTVTDQQVTASQMLKDIGYAYVYNYTGTNEFILSLQTQIQRGRELSVKQLRGAANCLLAEYRASKRNQGLVQASQELVRSSEAPRPPIAVSLTLGDHTLTMADLSDSSLQINPDELATLKQLSTLINGAIERAAKPAPQAPSAAPQAPQADDQEGDTEGAIKLSAGVSDGTYTVVLDETGTYRTIRVLTPKYGEFAPGTQLAQYLSGPDNTRNFTTFAVVNGDSYKLIRQYQGDGYTPNALHHLLAASFDDQINYGNAYAMRSKRCFRCGRILTVPSSVAQGLGPECAEKLGLV